jgi:hypothetical protein
VLAIDDACEAMVRCRGSQWPEGLWRRPHLAGPIRPSAFLDISGTNNSQHNGLRWLSKLGELNGHGNQVSGRVDRSRCFKLSTESAGIGGYGYGFIHNVEIPAGSHDLIPVGSHDLIPVMLHNDQSTQPTGGGWGLLDHQHDVNFPSNGPTGRASQ